MNILIENENKVYTLDMPKDENEIKVSLKTYFELEDVIKKEYPYEVERNNMEWLKGIITFSKTPQNDDDYYDHYKKEAERHKRIAKDFKIQAHEKFGTSPAVEKTKITINDEVEFITFLIFVGLSFIVIKSLIKLSEFIF